VPAAPQVAAATEGRSISGLKNLTKSIDTLLRVQLKDAPSPVFARSAAGEGITGKNKNSGKIEKSVDAFVAFRLQATLHRHE